MIKGQWLPHISDWGYCVKKGTTCRVKGVGVSLSVRDREISTVYPPIVAPAFIPYTLVVTCDGLWVQFVVKFSHEMQTTPDEASLKHHQPSSLSCTIIQVQTCSSNWLQAFF